MPTINPFKGPKSYEDGDDFYGRKTEIKEIYNLIRSEVLTLIFSRSGTGKTSLLKAGLQPFLREEFNFLPVYIHLNASAVKKTHAADLSHYVIECCKEQIGKHLENKKNFKVKASANTIFNSLFEFVHNLTLTQVVTNKLEMQTTFPVSPLETNFETQTEYNIKPVLIFDQFEEIFTLPFERDSLQFLLKEIDCLLDDKIPEYLDKTFKGHDDERYLKLKNTLMSKQRNFRIVFSFREEYLPQFESLQIEIPAIKYTNSRYRLEPFSVDTSTEVILKTAPEIREDAACLVSKNLAINVLNNFNRIVVEPFLLSLVCQKIYKELLEPEIGEGDATAEKIRNMVNNAIEVYIGDVYNCISNETKEFIENKLVTSDNKRTPFNYLEATRNPQLKKDIDRLTTEPEYRLLNLEQFLDSLHIELLHDRLLPPIAKRRDARKELKEAEILRQRQWELEQKYVEAQNKREEFHRIRRKKQRAFLYTVILSSLILMTVAIIVIMNKVQYNKAVLAKNVEISKNRDSINTLLWMREKDNITQRNIASELSDKNVLLVAANNRTDSISKIVQSGAIQLRMQNRRLLATEKDLLNAKKSLEETNNDLQFQNESIIKEREDKNNLADIFRRQTSLLISNLQRTAPFTTLALAHSNYHQIANMGLKDTGTVQEFERTFLNTYNETHFFDKQTVAMYFDFFSKGNALAATSVVDPKTNTLDYHIYNLADLTIPPVVLDISNDPFDENQGSLNAEPIAILPKDTSDLYKTEFPESSRAITRLRHGFSDEGDFMYVIVERRKRSILKIWEIKNESIRREPYWIKDVTDINLNGIQTIIARSGKLAFIKNPVKGFYVNSFDIKTKKENSYTFKLKNNIEVFKDISFANTSIVTKFINDYRIYSQKSKRSSFDLKATPGGGYVTDIRYYDGDSLSYLSKLDSASYAGFINSAGIQVSNMVNFTSRYPSILYTDPHRLIYYDLRSANIEVRIRNNNYQQPMLKYSFNFTPDPPFISLSSDKSLLAVSGSRSIAVFDMVKYQLIDTFYLPESIRNKPVFDAGNKCLITAIGSQVYTLYFRRPKNIKTVKELENLLNSNIFGRAWPLSGEEKDKYGIKYVDHH